MIDLFNAGITRAFDALLAPFSSLHPCWGLLFVSALSGLVLLKLFGVSSNQTAIRDAKKAIQAHILEIVLYKDHFAISLHAAGQALTGNAVYLLHAALPLMVMTLPCLLILAQLALRYDSRGLGAGEVATVKVQLDPGVPLENVSISASSGLEIHEPPLRLRGKNEISWRVTVRATGEQKIEIQYAGQSFEKKIAAGSQAKISPARVRHAVKSLFHPGEKRLDSSSPVAEITVKYPPQAYRAGPVELHWLFIFFAVSLAGGMAFRKTLKVEI